MQQVSFYFSAGDFHDVLTRFDKGLPQFYQTHNEVARLINDLSDRQIRTTIFSLVTPERKQRAFGDLVKVVDLGASLFTDSALLVQSIQEFPADAIIAQYPIPQLLKAGLAAKRRMFPILASTDNKTGVRPWLRRRKLIHLLNHPRIDLVANHCMPATKQLARFGVNQKKLVAWDITHPSHPSARPAKVFPEKRPLQIFYAGSISEAKGVGDLIRALPLVLGAGIDAQYVLAGGGAVEPMRTLSRSLGVEQKVVFAGMVPNPEVQERMAQADVVAVPSRAEFPEGFPLTMFEAIASRTPVLCSDHPVFRDLFVDGQNAAVFKGGDTASLARALVRILSDSDLYRRLSSNAEMTWDLFKGPADWRTLVKTWLFEGAQAPWIQTHVLSNMRA